MTTSAQPREQVACPYEKACVSPERCNKHRCAMDTPVSAAPATPRTDALRNSLDWSPDLNEHDSAIMDRILEAHAKIEYELAESCMTLRDYFAAQTLPSCLTIRPGWAETIAKRAYEVADAMLAERAIDHSRQLKRELAESYKKGYRDGAIQALNDASTTKEKP